MSRLAVQVWALTSTLLAVAAPAAALIASPEAVVFNTLDETASVTVMGDAGPIGVNKVRGHELYVGENTYGYMIDVRSQDGKLVIKPKELEAGSYLLVANTDAGEVRIPVYAPLAALPSTLEEQAALLGIGVDELKQRLGIGAPVPREEVQIDLPPVHYVGQILHISVPSSADNMVEWSLNGEVIQRGQNAHILNHTFSKEGTYVLSYVETRNGAVVASDTSVTRVVAPPAVVTTVAPNTEVILRGPQQYARHTWTLDGNRIGSDPTLRFISPQPGEYIVENRAEGSPAGGNEFQQTRYVVIVQRPG